MFDNMDMDRQSKACTHESTREWECEMNNDGVEKARWGEELKKKRGTKRNRLNSPSCHHDDHAMPKTREIKAYLLLLCKSQDRQAVL